MSGFSTRSTDVLLSTRWLSRCYEYVAARVVLAVLHGSCRTHSAGNQRVYHMPDRAWIIQETVPFRWLYAYLERNCRPIVCVIPFNTSGMLIELSQKVWCDKMGMRTCCWWGAGESCTWWMRSNRCHWSLIWVPVCFALPSRERNLSRLSCHVGATSRTTIHVCRFHHTNDPSRYIYPLYVSRLAPWQ